MRNNNSGWVVAVVELSMSGRPDRADLLRVPRQTGTPAPSDRVAVVDHRPHQADPGHHHHLRYVMDNYIIVSEILNIRNSE